MYPPISLSPVCSANDQQRSCAFLLQLCLASHVRYSLYSFVITLHAYIHTCFPSRPLAVVSAQVTSYTSSDTCSSTGFTTSDSSQGTGQCCVKEGGRSYKWDTGPCWACVGKCYLIHVRSLPSASVFLPRQCTGFFQTRPPPPYLSQASLAEKGPSSPCTLDT